MTKNKVINKPAYSKDRVIYTKHDPFSKDRIAAPVTAIIVFVFCTLHLSSGLLTLASAIYDYKCLDSKIDFYTISNSLFVSIIGSLCFLLHSQSFFISALLATAGSLYKRKLNGVIKIQKVRPNLTKIGQNNKPVLVVTPSTPCSNVKTNVNELASSFSSTC